MPLNEFPDLAPNNRWKIVGTAPYKNSRQYFGCVCSCGTIRSVSADSLRRNLSKSCGCWKREVLQLQKKIHGQSNSSEWNIWQSMRQRCEDPQNPYYGGRGITVCSRWSESFENFIADMGKRPSKKYSLDRINNDGNYEPENCRWATAKEQTNNRRRYGTLSFFTEQELVEELARRHRAKSLPARIDRRFRPRPDNGQFKRLCDIAFSAARKLESGTK